MLVLARRENESIMIDDRIRITVLGVRGNQIRLGIEAPREMPVVREELVGTGADAFQGLLPGPRLPFNPHFSSP
jgi:carbon storage regulator